MAGRASQHRESEWPTSASQGAARLSTQLARTAAWSDATVAGHQPLVRVNAGAQLMQRFAQPQGVGVWAEQFAQRFAAGAFRMPQIDLTLSQTPPLRRQFEVARRAGPPPVAPAAVAPAVARVVPTEHEPDRVLDPALMGELAPLGGILGGERPPSEPGPAASAHSGSPMSVSRLAEAGPAQRPLPFVPVSAGPGALAVAPLARQGAIPLDALDRSPADWAAPHGEPGLAGPDLAPADHLAPAAEPLQRVLRAPVLFSNPLRRMGLLPSAPDVSRMPQALDRLSLPLLTRQVDTRQAVRRMPSTSGPALVGGLPPLMRQMQLPSSPATLAPIAALPANGPHIGAQREVTTPANEALPAISRRSAQEPGPLMPLARQEAATPAMATLLLSRSALGGRPTSVPPSNGMAQRHADSAGGVAPQLPLALFRSFQPLARSTLPGRLRGDSLPVAGAPVQAVVAASPIVRTPTTEGLPLVAQYTPLQPQPLRRMGLLPAVPEHSRAVPLTPALPPVVVARHLAGLDGSNSAGAPLETPQAAVPAGLAEPTPAVAARQPAAGQDWSSPARAPLETVQASGPTQLATPTADHAVPTPVARQPAAGAAERLTSPAGYQLQRMGLTRAAAALDRAAQAASGAISPVVARQLANGVGMPVLRAEAPLPGLARAAEPRTAGLGISRRHAGAPAAGVLPLSWPALGQPTSQAAAGPAAPATPPVAELAHQPVEASPSMSLPALVRTPATTGGGHGATAARAAARSPASQWPIVARVSDAVDWPLVAQRSPVPMGPALLPNLLRRMGLLPTAPDLSRAAVLVAAPAATDVPMRAAAVGADLPLARQTTDGAPGLSASPASYRLQRMGLARPTASFEQAAGAAQTHASLAHQPASGAAESLLPPLARAAALPTGSPAISRVLAATPTAAALPLSWPALGQAPTTVTPSSGMAQRQADSAGELALQTPLRSFVPFQPLSRRTALELGAGPLAAGPAPTANGPALVARRLELASSPAAPELLQATSLPAPVARQPVAGPGAATVDALAGWQERAAGATPLAYGQGAAAELPLVAPDEQTGPHGTADSLAERIGRRFSSPGELSTGLLGGRELPLATAGASTSGLARRADQSQTGPGRALELARAVPGVAPAAGYTAEAPPLELVLSQQISRQLAPSELLDSVGGELPGSAADRAAPAPTPMAEPDIAALAQKVYDYLRRTTRIEQERLGRW